jgi:hypothetical protein
MSYYILPKNNNSIDINLKLECHDIKSYTSQSLYNFYKESKKQLNFFLQTNDSIITFENLLKVINPYEYIFSKIPGYKHSVSKLKTQSNIFYDVLEIFNTLNVLDTFFNKSIKSIHISEHYMDSNKCINFLRENHNDENTNFQDITEEIYNTINDKRYDFIFYEIKNTEFENLNYYTLNIIQVLMILLKYQSNNGVCLIKINNIFHKPIIDILYILCSIYEKVYIIKPNTSNIMSFDKYIVCKNFTLNENKKELYKNYYFKLAQIINTYLQNNNNNNILSIIDCEIPLYFVNKIDDTNIIIGQQQLESIDQVINILKNKNKEDKIENIKKSNIQKCVIWCEKFKIPHNKFSEKVNIFLPLKIENEENNNKKEKDDNEEV